MKRTLTTIDGRQIEIEERELLRQMLVSLCDFLATHEQRYRSVPDSLAALGLPIDGEYCHHFSGTADLFAMMREVFEGARDSVNTLSDSNIFKTFDTLAAFFQVIIDAMPDLDKLAAYDAVRMAKDYRNIGGKPESDDWNRDLLTERRRDLAIKQALEKKYGVQLIVKPEITPWQAGRPFDAGYERAFARIYLTRECSPAEAFELYLSENQITPTDEDDRYQIWQRFDKAMKRRRKAAQ